MSLVSKSVQLIYTILLSPHYSVIEDSPAYSQSVYLTVLLSQFADGVYLVLLMGLLEGYFVPLYNFFLTPENFDQKVKCDFLFCFIYIHQ